MTFVLWLLIWTPGPFYAPLPLPNPTPEDCIVVPLEKAHPVETDPILSA